MNKIAKAIESLIDSENLTVEFTGEEIQIIIESLRINEKNSRTAFADYLREKFSTESEEVIDEKVKNARNAWKKIVTLRAKLGDALPVIPNTTRGRQQ